MYPTKLCAIFENKIKYSMISEFPKVLPENFQKQSTISAMWQNTKSTCKNQRLSYTTTKTYRDLLVPTMAFFISSLFLISSPPTQCLAQHDPYSCGFRSWEECKITGYLKKSYRSQLNIYYLKFYRSTYGLIHKECIWNLSVWVDNTPYKSHR